MEWLTLGAPSLTLLGSGSEFYRINNRWVVKVLSRTFLWTRLSCSQMLPYLEGLVLGEWNTSWAGGFANLAMLLKWLQTIGEFNWLSSCEANPRKFPGIRAVLLRSRIRNNNLRGYIMIVWLNLQDCEDVACVRRPIILGDIFNRHFGFANKNDIISKLGLNQTLRIFAQHLHGRRRHYL